MSTRLEMHPSADQLRAFVHGRLAADELQAVESHIADCDSCCEQLADVPDDTLVQLARQAATQGVKSADTPVRPPQPKADARTIPPELRDHPRYHVLGLIATGGMGAVYKAQHRLMERLVALKVISPSLLASPAAVERFLREFKAAAKLSHPNIVAAHDAEKAGDLHFLVMEFVEGLSLDRLVAQTGPLAPAQACHFMRQAALGLAHIQQQGMVHRDIKPQNLMVTRKGQLKILDCGLARIASQHADVPASGKASQRPDATAEGMILGTPDYIAPEQIADARSADIRADIYSLGCTLYFLLTGQPPFPRGSVMDKLASHASHAPQSINDHRSDLPAELARILERMMAKDPAQRYQTPSEVTKDLAPLAKGQGSELLASGRRQPPDDIVLPANVPLAAAPTPLAPTLAQSFPPPVAVPADQPVLLGTEYSVLTPQTSVRQRQSKRPNSTLIAPLAIAALGLVLAIPLAWPLFSTPSRPDQPARPSANRPAPINSPPAIAGKPTTVPIGQLPRKVLLVVPRQGLYFPDYGNVKLAFANHRVPVVTACTSLEKCGLLPASPPGEAYPDILLDSSVRAADYGAIIFAGFMTDDYHPGGLAGSQVRRLLDEFKSQGKPITSICVGQRVLAQHGELDGKRVARCGFVDGSFGTARPIWRSTPLETDGPIITAARDTDAAPLASAIVATLDKQ